MADTTRLCDQSKRLCGLTTGTSKANAKNKAGLKSYSIEFENLLYWKSRFIPIKKIY